MNAAVHAARQVPQNPRVGVAEVEVAGLGALTRTFYVVEDPLNLRTGEVGRQSKATNLTEAIGAFVTFKFLDDVGGTHVLPDNRVVDGLTGVLIPHDGGFTLVGDADGGQLVTVNFRLLQRISDDLTRGIPDLDRVVLNPTGVREDLGEFLLPDRDNLTGVIEDDCSGRSRTLVDCHDEFFSSHEFPFESSVTSLCLLRQERGSRGQFPTQHPRWGRRREPTSMPSRSRPCP